MNLATALNPAGVPANKTIEACLTAERMPAPCNANIKSGLSAASLLTLIGLAPAHSASSNDQALARERLRLEAALASFYHSDNDRFGTQAARRDRLQQRLIIASDQNCATFGQTLYGTQASTNFILGSLATGLAGAGAITTNEQTARLLSGLSGIATGVRSEANEDFFRKQWMEAVVKAIDSSRAKMRTDMALRTSQSIAAYPVEAAIADAIRYNGECSLVAGMKEVNAAVAIADDPAGMKAFRSAFRQAGYKVNFSLEGGGDDSDIPATQSAVAVDRREMAGQAAGAARTLDDAVQDLHARAPALFLKAQTNKRKTTETDLAGVATQAETDLRPQMAELQGYTANAAKLDNELTALLASDQVQRKLKLAQIRANDAKAAAVLELAFERIYAAQDAMQALAIAQPEQAATPPPQAPHV